MIYIIEYFTHITSIQFSQTHQIIVGIINNIVFYNCVVYLYFIIIIDSSNVTIESYTHFHSNVNNVIITILFPEMHFTVTFTRYPG